MESGSRKYLLNIRGTLRELQLPCVMGILNITPDSFYEASRVDEIEDVLSKCGQMLREGAAIIDIGAASTRPGAIYPGAKIELQRLQKVFPKLRKQFPDAIFSIDTWNAEVAERMIDMGADIINDISSGELDPHMLNVIVRSKVPYIIMHMRGQPENMQQFTDYINIVSEINTYFVEKIRELRLAGISDIIIDPGFGFSKTIEQNYELLGRLNEFLLHGVPVLVGLSRKSMISKSLGCSTEETLCGTTAANTIALMNGASLLRVHDAKAAVDAIAIFKNIQYPL
ncbi:MAG: dihydropteroate synthase [Bacteroidetes bacterium HGW-Bacteroidetes-6]|jgi:dihydropteroate synthase|nr:MAG: dihydropteroate synthase [Bacteroidetes bacterium HGW-Bacteroidetes-6]